MRTLGIFACIFLLLLSIDGLANKVYSSSDEIESIVDTRIFPHNEVIDVYIDIEEEDYAYMVEHASSEEMVMATINYNGYEFSQVGVRPKGNSSLSQVIRQGSERFSLKIDLDYYADDQNFYGITKLNLNNLYSDPTMMAEYLGYEMMDELDIVSPRTTYAALYINGEYNGLYLAVEQIDEAFLINNYGEAQGELYKPEMGLGSDLRYISHNEEDYDILETENNVNADHEEILAFMKAIDEGSDLEEIFNVQDFLKYLAVSVATVHLDGYQGNMFHNYYLYNNQGEMQWIPWDLNMIFNGFPKAALSDIQATAFLIDEPVSGAMENYPLIEAVLSQEQYRELYHGYLQELMDGYLSSNNFTNKVVDTYNMIKSYVEADPTSFYKYEDFEEALFGESETNLSILEFVDRRVENMGMQLSNEIPSTNDGKGNEGEKTRGIGNKQQPNAQVEGKEGQQKQRPPREDQPPMDMTEAIKNLLEEVNIEELPEELRSYIEKGEMPPKEVVAKYKDELPQSFFMQQQQQQQQGQQSPMGKGVKPQDEAQQPTLSVEDMMTHILFLALGILLMAGAIVLLSRKKIS